MIKVRAYWEGGTIPWLNSGSVNNPLIKTPSAHITARGLRESSTRWVPKGSLLIALAGQGKTKGTVAQLCFNATCNQSVVAIVPTSAGPYSRYLYWWLASQYQNIRNLAGGDLRDGLNLEHVGSIRVPLPPRLEQHMIVDFLDRETAKIDALISKQEQLIATLREDRTATITHAVTKGLKPDVELRDSGVDWLDRFPNRWAATSIKHVALVHDCKHVTAEYVEEGFPLASIREVQARFVTLENPKYTTKEYYEASIEGGRRPQPGDLIFSRNVTVGEVAQVPEHCREFAMGQDVCLIRPDTLKATPPFLWFVLRSRATVLQLELMMIGSTFKRINVENIRSLQMALPSTQEQAEIVQFLEERCAKIGTLIAKATEMITTLREYRFALITAAVTGKIDVREAA